MSAIDRIRAEQIRSIYRNTPPGLIATLLAMAAMVGVLVYMDAVEPVKSAVFVAVMTAQVAARMLIYRAYSRAAARQEDWRRWAAWFTGGTIVGGVVIGS